MEELQRLFKVRYPHLSLLQFTHLLQQADSPERIFLDFEDFFGSIKLLKDVPRSTDSSGKLGIGFLGLYFAAVEHGRETARLFRVRRTIHVREAEIIFYPPCARSLQGDTNILCVQSTHTIRELHAVFKRYSVPVEVDTSSTPASPHMTTETFSPPTALRSQTITQISHTP